MTDYMPAAPAMVPDPLESISTAHSILEQDNVAAICPEGLDADRKRLVDHFLGEKDYKSAKNLDGTAPVATALENCVPNQSSGAGRDPDESFENLSLRDARSAPKDPEYTARDESKLKVAKEDLDFLILDDMKPHADEAQVVLDVKRSFALLSQFHSDTSSYTTILSGDEVKAMRRKLYFLIVQMLRKYPCLHYYQGYHDIASVVLLVCENDDEAFRMLEILTLYHLRDYMLSDISLTINHLKLIPVILENADPSLFHLIRAASPSYQDSEGIYYDYKFTPALSSLLTLFSHDLANMNLIIKLWNFIFRYNSVGSCAYFYAAAIMHYKDSIITTVGGLNDADSALLHSLLSPAKLFEGLTESDLLSILDSASSLISQFPLDASPNSAASFNVWFEEYNSKSVLATTSKLGSRSDLLLDADSLRHIMDAQEVQSANESRHEFETLQAALDKAESTLASSEELEKSSLFSSLSMSSSVASLTNSSIIKKIFVSGNDKPSSPSSSIFKLSLCVGFAGIIIHFLLRQSGWYFITRMSRYVNNTLGDKSLTYAEINRVTNVLGEVCSHVKDTLARESIDLGQVGLGTLKRHIYSLGNLK